MFTTIYNFIFEWLFYGEYPAYLSTQGAELAAVLFSVIIIVAVIALAIIPIRAIISFICNIGR